MIHSREQLLELRTLIQGTIDRLYVDDSNIINRLGLEKSLTFRFGLYFKEAISEIDWLNTLTLDMEYNKNGDRPKRTPRRPRGAQHDLILHQRNSNLRNSIVFEIKGWWNNEDRRIDHVKLEDFTHQDGEYKYGLGVFLDFQREACPLIFYVNSEQIII